MFEYAYAPERSAERAMWEPVPAEAMHEPGIVDLMKIYGGSDSCAYAKTVITSDRAQPAVLELGSDDGVKVWLNGEVVHENDVARSLALRSDRVSVDLNKGRNTLMIKVTQGGGDWAFAARLRDPEGLRLEGVSFQAPE
jgi:hypothetical protein